LVMANEEKKSTRKRRRGKGKKPEPTPFSNSHLIPGTPEYTKLKEASPHLLTAGLFQEEYEKAVKRGDETGARLASSRGVSSLALHDFHTNLQKAREVKKEVKVPLRGPSLRLVPEQSRPKAQPKQERKRKPFPLITPNYAEWVDHPGLLNFLRDPEGKYYGVDTFDSDFGGGPFRRYTFGEEDVRLAATAKRRQKLEKEYFEALKKVPEVVRVMNLITHQKSKETLHYELEHWTAQGKVHYYEGAGFMFHKGLEGTALHIQKHADTLRTFLTLPNGSYCDKEEQILWVLGKQAEQVEKFSKATKIIDLLTILEVFLKAGWQVKTMRAN